MFVEGRLRVPGQAYSVAVQSYCLPSCHNNPIAGDYDRFAGAVCSAQETPFVQGHWISLGRISQETFGGSSDALVNSSLCSHLDATVESVVRLDQMV